MKPYPVSVAAYGKADGGEWHAGDTIRLADLGRTLTAIATRGPDAFYSGWIADSIAASMRANGGLISKKDLAQYQAKVRTPLRGKYHGYELITMPPPTSGGVVMIEMLNILENFDLPKLGALSAQALHYEIEAMRRGYLDRARFLGDPDFVKMPLDRLTSKAYAKTLAASIDPSHASSSAELGKDILTQIASATEEEETTQFSIVDKNGNAVLANSQPGTTGNLAVNTPLLRGPGQLSFNGAAGKTFTITERTKMTVRADIINLLNKPQWGNPTTDINSASFGRINSATGNRTVTFNARIDF